MKIRSYEYESFSDDFFDDGREHRLPDDYVWIKTDLWSRTKAAFSYGLALVFSNIYCRLFLHISIRGGKVLRKEKGGYFIFANHTQPVGDVFTPALAAFPKRIYTVVSPANFDIPVIGKLIFSLGALPTPTTLGGMKKFREAVKTRINEGHPVVIYPEAHVWHYYTGIRPLSAASFTLAVECSAPVYTMTSTYKKRKLGKKPKIVVCINGPFYGEGDAPRAQAIFLCDKVYAEMCDAAKGSDCEYIKYLKKEK